MKIDRPRRKFKTIDLLPLINVVFLLILFVLIAGRPTTDHPNEIEVALSTQEAAYIAAPFSVRLGADDKFYLAGNAPKSLSEIAAQVAQTGIGAQGLAVELIADRRAHAAALMDFRQAMSKAGVGEIRIKTEFAPEQGHGN